MPRSNIGETAKSSTIPSYLMKVGFTVTKMNEWMDVGGLRAGRHA